MSANYFISGNEYYRDFKNIIITAEPGSTIIVPSEKVKEQVEGGFWVHKTGAGVNVLVDHSKFFTGQDAFTAEMKEWGSPQTWENLTDQEKDFFNRVAVNITTIINEKGGWPVISSGQAVPAAK